MHGVTLILTFNAMINSEVTIISDPSPCVVTFRNSLVVSFLVRAF